MATNLLSVAGLVGSPITIDTRTARVVDIVMRQPCAEAYPQINGLVVRVGRRLLFLASDHVDGLFDGGPLRGRGDQEPFARRSSDVLLAADVLDRQLVDTDGMHVIRAADLYLAPIGGTLRLVALDTSVRALVRRLGPRRLRGRTSPTRVIDWCHIGALTGMPDVLYLSAPHTSLPKVPARELASALVSSESVPAGPLASVGLASVGSLVSAGEHEGRS
jgi:hypothetical protein